MLPDPIILRHILHWHIRDMKAQGHQTDGLNEQLDQAGASYDRLAAVADVIALAPMRSDWTWHEPDDWAGITDNWDAQDLSPQAITDDDAQARIHSAFTTSCAGCMLGKPLEVSTDLAHIRAAAETVGDWPISDYIREAHLDALGKRHWSWTTTARNRMQEVSPDDDLSYTLIGMLVLEKKGDAFATEDVAWAWFENIPSGWTWGPESQVLAKMAAYGRYGSGLKVPLDVEHWRTRFIGGSELCGALIRADAYGYACPGDPRRAAAYAWRDARLTHRRTGVYATMFAAAAIAAAFTERDRLTIFRRAAHVIPRNSRFRDVVDQSIAHIASASDWLDGYQRIHGAFGAYGHCEVYQEIGTLINSVYFAKDGGDGICKQVMQGNDTDSFGCTAGSILGAYFGPGHLAESWTAPFHNRIRTALAAIGSQGLDVLCQRLAALPALCKPSEADVQ